MFYCTLYKSYNRVNTKNKTFELSTCLAYASEIDAEDMKNRLLQQASKAGASIIEDSGNYITFYGSIYFTGFGFASGKNFGSNLYSIGVENTETRFSKLIPETRNTVDLRKILDGADFERKAQGYTQHIKDLKKAEQDKINDNLSRFEQEVANETDLTKILTSLLKYAGQKTDKQKLIALAVKKIQSKTDPAEETDWYNELSDINN